MGRQGEGYSAHLRAFSELLIRLRSELGNDLDKVVILAVIAPAGRAGPFGFSGASLHAKTFAVDGARIFVGSFNFDPRSTMLNTEMGLLIDSERLAQGVHDTFDNGLSGQSWRVERGKRGLVWTDPADPDAPALAREPGSNFPRRIALAVIGWLPVECLL